MKMKFILYAVALGLTLLSACGPTQTRPTPPAPPPSTVDLTGVSQVSLAVDGACVRSRRHSRTVDEQPNSALWAKVAPEVTRMITDLIKAQGISVVDPSPGTVHLSATVNCQAQVHVEAIRVKRTHLCKCLADRQCIQERVTPPGLMMEVRITTTRNAGETGGVNVVAGVPAEDPVQTDGCGLLEITDKDKLAEGINVSDSLFEASDRKLPEALSNLQAELAKAFPPKSNVSAASISAAPDPAAPVTSSPPL